MDKNRLEILKSHNFDRLALIEEYEKCDSLDELKRMLTYDFYLLVELQREDVDRKTANLYNFVRAFRIWLFQSNHNSPPLGLWEDNIYGTSYYNCMVEIYEKLKDKHSEV